MAAQDLVFYSSENGDDWLLVSGVDSVVVRHRPNSSSGGTSSDVSLDTFLSREQNTPQNKALRQLLEQGGANG